MASNSRPWWTTASLCAGIIAVCYGFGRYAYGLFVPEFGEVFGLSGTGLGILGGLSTAGYTAGLLAAPAASRRSARGCALLAGASTGAGLLLLASTELLPLFALGHFIAGSGAGLVSPGVAELIGRTVAREAEPQAQTWANTGTSLGLAVSAFAPALVFGWQVTWLGFALLAAAATASARLLLPPDEQPEEPGRGGLFSGLRRRGLWVLLLNSLLLGATSAPYWNFFVERLAETDVPGGFSSWFWLTIGLAGPLGGAAGALVRRHGLGPVNLGAWSLWAAAMGMLALPGLHPVVALVSAAVFGAAFMGLTGLCILWAARLFPEAPARGVTLSFLLLGLGQTLGSPAAGALADVGGLPAVFALTAAASLAVWHQAHPALRPPSATRSLSPARG